MNRAGIVAVLHGMYWALGATWPLVHMESFLWLTGPKEELWLVRCLSLLMVVVGLVLLFAFAKKRITPELKWLGLGGAASLAFIDFFYYFQDVIPFPYLLDGIAELALVVLWLWVGNHGLVKEVRSPEK